MYRPRKYEWVLLIISLLCAAVSIITWILFPIIYPKAVASHLKLKQNSDGSLGYSSFLYTHPPTVNTMRFYMFNVTNPDEVKYYGEKPMLIEVGPYTVIETEEKKYTKWTDDGEQLFYENYKRYVLHDEYSCPTCSFEDIVTIPNPAQLGASTDMENPQYGVTPVGKTIISLGLILLGEYPFVSQKVGDILFNGYDDALLDAAHSNVVAFLSGILNGGKSIIPIPVPSMKRLGFFQGYNNTQDEHYWINTGKNDVSQLGKVISWANLTELPSRWWSTDYARSIRGSDTGSFAKMQLSKSDVLPMFQSFLCRSFDRVFLKENTVDSIPGYTYNVPYEQYDTTADQNKGFRYKNAEKVNYYSNWPNCPDKSPENCTTPVDVEFCSLQANLCHNCCNGSFVNGTYLLPPGMFPLVCYPGRLEDTPFAVVYSPPHFLFSPPEVVNSVYGLAPDPSKHQGFLYTHEPFSGTALEVTLQLMVSVPMFASSHVTQNMNLAQTMMPMFWQGATGELKDVISNQVWLGFVLVPKLVDGVKYFLLALSLFLLALTVICALKRKRTQDRTFSFDLKTASSKTSLSF